MLSAMRNDRWAARYTDLQKASTGGVIRTATLVEFGVAASTIVRNCRTGGRWQRLLPGVVLLHNGVPTHGQRSTAALLYAGGDALLTGHAALAEYGFRRSSGRSTVHVLIPHHRRRSSSGYVTVERTRRLPLAVMRGRQPCAALVRCAIDAARTTQDLDQCRTLLAEILQRGDTSLEELAIELAAGTKRGSAMPRQILGELGGNAHSKAEIDAQRVYARSGLPPMVFNRDLEDVEGNFVARPDGWLDDVGLAWEIDSLRHHLSVPDHEATVRRRAQLRRRGAIVVETLPRDLDLDPDGVIAELRDSYSTAVQRPRPPFRLRPALRGPLSSVGGRVGGPHTSENDGEGTLQ